MCGLPEDSWEALHPVVVITATVVDVHEVSINLSRAIGEIRRIGLGCCRWMRTGRAGRQDLHSRGFAPPVGVSATTGMVREVMRWYSANPGYRSAALRSVACTSTMSSPTSMRALGLAFRFQYQAGLSSAPAFEANTR